MKILISLTLVHIIAASNWDCASIIIFFLLFLENNFFTTLKITIGETTMGLFQKMLFLEEQMLKETQFT